MPWALFDADGRLARTGTGTPAEWPDATQHEAVLAPAVARLVALTLPPMAAARLASAVRFALDDQLAAPSESLHVVVLPQQRDGIVRAAVIDRQWIEALADFRPGFERAWVLGSLFAVDGDWHWVGATAADACFLLRPDGSALAAENPHAADVALALQEARSRGKPPARVLAHGVDAIDAASLSVATGTPWVAAPAWSWEQVPMAAYAQAADMLAAGSGDAAAPGMRTRLSAALRPALGVAYAAAAVFLVGLTTSWAYERIDQWRSDSALVALARDAGVNDADTPATATAGLARLYRDAQHSAGRTVPDDALPLLAAAAPALAGLPHGSVKRAVYASGAWTVEFTALDSAARAALDNRLGDAGVTAVAAVSRDGVRMRVTP